MSGNYWNIFPHLRKSNVSLPTIRALLYWSEDLICRNSSLSKYSGRVQPSVEWPESEPEPEVDPELEMVTESEPELENGCDQCVAFEFFTLLTYTNTDVNLDF